MVPMGIIVQRVLRQGVDFPTNGERSEKSVNAS
jgi:hypothetical protein